eukprot:gene23707-28290_t
MQCSRFVELRNVLPGISEKVLTQELRFFESSGIVKKEVFNCSPQKVEY